MSIRIPIPRKHWAAVLHDTARLLDDLAPKHSCPEYVRGYAKDLRRAIKQIDSEILRGYGREHTR
jgi:hypothetical protein